MFVDGEYAALKGHEEPYRADFIPPGPPGVWSGIADVSGGGPYLGDAAQALHGLPRDRHPKDGVSAAFVDGSAAFLRPVEWSKSSGPSFLPGFTGEVRSYVQRFSPNARITPYNPDGDGRETPGATRR